MSILLGHTSARQTLLDLATIDRAGKLDELETRMAQAKVDWRNDRAAVTIDRASAQRYAAIANRYLGGQDEYLPTLEAAAGELAQWECVVVHVVRRLALECRRAAT